MKNIIVDIKNTIDFIANQIQQKKKHQWTERIEKIIQNSTQKEIGDLEKEKKDLMSNPGEDQRAHKGNI